MKRIMLVDDEPQILKIVTVTLEKNGYEVTSTPKSTEALSSLMEAKSSGHPFDLLITDLQMPEMTGFELIEALTKHSSTLPTIAITGYGSKEAVIQLMHLGCADYIDKPFEMKSLLGRVKALLPNDDSNGSKVDADEPGAGVASSPGGDNEQEDDAIGISDENGWKTISFAGDMTYGMATKLRLCLVDMLDNDVKQFILDLGKVKKIDPLCLSVLLCFGRMLSRESPGYNLKISNANEEIVHFFHNAGIDELYRIAVAGGK